MKRILVTDGAERAALATVRSLGAAGYAVEVCSVKGASIAGASRFCTAEHRAPDSLANPDAFASRVGALVQERRIDVLVPVTDAALMCLLPVCGELGDVLLPFASAEAHARISDKTEVAARARGAGVAAPATVVVHHAGDMPARGTLPEGPLVLKPARSVVDTGTGRRKTRVSYVAGSDRLSAALAALPEEAFPVLVQERIEGPGEGVFVLMWDGVPIARFAHRRIREKPPTGGVSVYREAVPVEPDLAEGAVKLLQAFGWQGVAMVELKRSVRDGVPYVMEVNGRLWGSLQLAIDAGVDFPRLLVEAALGGNPKPVTTYRTGIRSRWWLGDLDHLLLRLRKRYEPRTLPPGSGGRLSAVMRFLVPWRPGDRGEVFRWGDPGPGLRELAVWLRREG